MYTYTHLDKVPDDNRERQFIYHKLLPLSSKWMIIGGLLGMDIDDLDSIQSDNQGVDDRDYLYAMISMWLKQVKPPPTWKNAIKTIDQQIAKTLMQCMKSQ